MCETSGCHTGTLPDLHPTAKCATCHTVGTTDVKTCATVGCHDTKIDSSGNVIVHYYTDAGHTSASSSLAGDRYFTDFPAPLDGDTRLNAPLHWTSTCTDCHSMSLSAVHAGKTPAGGKVCDVCHNTGGTGAGDVLEGSKWNGTCLQSGCHTPDPNGGVPVSHLVNGQMDYSHKVAASLTALPGGCSASTGTFNGAPRTACHYSDIVQEHNRKIESGNSGTITKTVAVTCAQCHSSNAFKALNGTWDGTCDACHNGTTVESDGYVQKNHSLAGSAEYTRVRGLHDFGAYFSGSTRVTKDSAVAVPTWGTNSMDAHGPIRTGAVTTTSGNGCATSFCHTYAYVVSGYGSTSGKNCTTCHGTNNASANAPFGIMSVNNGAVFTISPSVTINSAITAKGGATMATMKVDPGSGVLGASVAYATSYPTTLFTTTPGMKIIRVEYTDSLGLKSTYTYKIWKITGPSTITASVSGGNGTISPSGAISVAYNTNQTFTFTPSAGYKVDTVTVDGTPLSSPGSSYTFTTVTAPHTIVVTFAPLTFASSGLGADSYSPPAGLPVGTNDYVGFQTGLTLAMSQALPANSKLTFNTKYDIEDGYDFGYVQVSTDGGTTWTNIAGTGTTNAEAAGLVNYVANLGNGITGSQSAWAPATFDLSAYAGQTVKIRFDYRCDSGFYGNGTVSGGIGWNVDDVAVGPIGAPVFTDDFSTMKGEWSTYTNTSGYVWGY